MLYTYTRKLIKELENDNYIILKLYTRKDGRCAWRYAIRYNADNSTYKDKIFDTLKKAKDFFKKTFKNKACYYTKSNGLGYKIKRIINK